MKKFKININPKNNEITYEIEGELDDILKINENDIQQIEEHFLKLKKKITLPSKEPTEKGNPKKEKLDTTEKLELNAPSNLIEKIESIKNEEHKIPILWSFSNNEEITVGEFLELCSREGFSLSTTWLPSEGGRFSTQLVKKEKIFHSINKRGNEKLWKFTKVGKLKVKKFIQDLDKK